MNRNEVIHYNPLGTLSLLALLLLAGCKSALVNDEDQSRRFSATYESLWTDVGAEEFGRWVHGVPQHGSMGLASQELPLPPSPILETFLKELGFQRWLGLPLSSTPDRGEIVTGYVLSSVQRDEDDKVVESATYDRLFIKVVPTGYGTTAVHLGLLRFLVTGDLMDRSGFFRLSSVWFDPTDPPSGVSVRVLPESIARRFAVTALVKLVTKLPSNPRYEKLFTEVVARREAHRVASSSPCMLELEASLDDRDSFFPNQHLDRGERVQLKLTLSNQGPGTAFGVTVVLHEARGYLPTLVPVELGKIQPGAVITHDIHLDVPARLPARNLEISVQATELRGYDSDPLELVLPVAPLVPPEVRITSAEIRGGIGDDGDGYLGSGETVELAVVVENVGRGPAAGVALLSSSAAPGLSIDGARRELGRIDAGESVDARIPVSLAPTAGDEPVEVLLVAVDGRGEEVGKAERRVSLPVVRRRPLIEISHRLYDGDSAHSSGDRDGVVQNGEAPELELRIANRGRLSAEAVEVELQTFPAEMAVAPGRLEIGTLPALTEGGARTVRLALPRSLDHVGPLRLTLVVHQRHFAPQRQTIELPFARRTPDLRVGPRLLAGLVPGRIEARTLLIQNVGELEARGVRTTVRAADPGLELLDHAGAPAPELSVEQAELRTADSALEVPVRLIAKGRATGVGSLTVEVRQEDFPPVVTTVEVPIEARVTQRMDIAPLPERPEPPTAGTVEDRTPPVVLILEPGDVDSQDGASFTVGSAQVRVRGTASDASGIYRVAVGESPVTVDAHGTFTAWVKLRFGRNDLRVTAEDVHGNVGAVRFTIERLGDAGRPRIDRALLFATDRYDHWSALSNPVADARELAATLEASYGFTVEVVANPTRVDVLRTLRRYADMEPGPEDQLLVFFAGHGHFDDRFDEGYLVTTESLRRDELGTSYLAFSQLANLLDGLPHRHLLVVLDACFGGAFDQRLSRARGPAEEPGSWSRAWVAERLRPLSRLYLAAGEIERVDDGPAGGNSPFMRRLLGALHQGTRGARPLTSRELFVLMDRPAPLAPEPRAGEFGDHEPEGDFLFIPASR